MWHYMQNDVYNDSMLNFAFFHLMYYRDKLLYCDKNLMITNIIVKSLLHTTITSHCNDKIVNKIVKKIYELVFLYEN